MTIASTDEDEEQVKFSYSAGGNEKWHDHFGKPFGIRCTDMEFGVGKLLGKKMYFTSSPISPPGGISDEENVAKGGACLYLLVASHSNYLS